MSASAIPLSALATSRRWQSNFLTLLPAVQQHARIRFRHLAPLAREEATAEAVARACVNYAHLARQRKLHCVYTGNLATFAVYAVRGGRHVGGRQSCRCVLSPLAQRKQHLSVVSLSPWHPREESWCDLLVASRKVSPADQAGFNVDFAAWLAQWPPRHRRIIHLLAAGSRTLDVARKFGVSEARISQLRREFQQSWEQFQGDTARVAAPRTQCAA